MKMPNHTICNEHQRNFEILTQAFLNSQVCIMDCIEKETNQHVAVICTITRNGKEYVFTPFAKFFNGNPFELLTPPSAYDTKE